jgi:hypothetical protein
MARGSTVAAGRRGRVLAVSKFWREALPVERTGRRSYSYLRATMGSIRAALRAGK